MWGGEDEGMWGGMGGGGVSDGEEGGGASTTTAPNPPPSQAATQPPPQPPAKKRKFSFESSDESDDRAIPRGKKPKPPAPDPPPHGLRRPPPPPNPPTPPPPPNQNRHPQDRRLSCRSDCRDGRPRPLPHRGREGHRPWYPRAEVRCRLGGIPGWHHPLRGVPLPTLPHPQGGGAVPGRGPGGHEKAMDNIHEHTHNALHVALCHC